VWRASLRSHAGRSLILESASASSEVCFNGAQQTLIRADRNRGYAQQAVSSGVWRWTNKMLKTEAGVDAASRLFMMTLRTSTESRQS
jgi:hypothetical protein